MLVVLAVILAVFLQKLKISKLKVKNHDYQLLKLEINNSCQFL